MHFKSVNVYVNLSKNSLSLQYGMHKTLVPFLPLCFICTVLSMWKMSECDWKAPYLHGSSASQRNCSFTYNFRKELIPCWISKETLKIQIENGVKRGKHREKGTKKNTAPVLKKECGGKDYSKGLPSLLGGLDIHSSQRSKSQRDWGLCSLYFPF